MSTQPLISCLCVTRDRVQLLKRSLTCFLDQTYINKELVIVYDDDDVSTKIFLNQDLDDTIKKFEVKNSNCLTLGERRNLAIQRCGGEYFCQWDDDDWSHNKRLEFQMNVIRESKMPACVMIHWLIFDAMENQAYVSNGRPWEGSILCKKALITEDMKYADSEKGEDTIIIKELFSRNLIFPVIMPKLYIYVHHGKNLWEREHWEEIFNASKKLSAESSKIIKDILDGKYSGEKASALLDQISE